MCVFSRVAKDKNDFQTYTPNIMLMHALLNSQQTRSLCRAIANDNGDDDDSNSSNKSDDDDNDSIHENKHTYKLFTLMLRAHKFRKIQVSHNLHIVWKLVIVCV